MNRLVKVLGIITIGYLLVLSVYGTCLSQTSDDGTTTNAFFGDFWLFHILMIAALVLLLWLLHGVLQRIDHRSVRRVVLIASCIYLVVGLLFLGSTQLMPSSDGAKVMQVARDILAGNMDAFERSGYMYRYPFQRGMVLLDIVAIRLFGESAYLSLQVLNLLALMVILVCVVWLIDHVWKEVCVSILTVLLHLLFLPIALYITHNYGIMYGIALSMISICLVYKAWTEYRPLYYVPAAITMALAVELKSNSLIWLIGLAMALMFSALAVIRVEYRHAIIGIVAIVGLLLAVKLASACSGAMMVHLTGREISRGMPKTCWIYMGLQDDDDKPGAYNGSSTTLFEECDYDYDAANQEATQRIVQLFGYMAHHPVMTVRQFVRKTAFEWNNPTFESLDIQIGRESAIDGYAGSMIEQSFQTGGFYHILVQYMNLYQTFILAFAFVAMMGLLHRSASWWEIMLLTIYLGGFAFHMFWEAKPQYTLPYFLLLIPYAAYGMGILQKRIMQRYTEHVSRGRSNNKN